MQKFVVQNVQAGRDLNIYIDAGSSHGVPAPFQLPPALDLVGRDQLITELVARLEVTANRKGVWLHGLPGVGKTAVLVQLAHNLRATYSDGQIFISFGASGNGKRKRLTPADAMRTVIQSFHPSVELPVDCDRLAATYRSVLTQAGKVILVFDDVAGPEQVTGLAPPDNCAWILSSRSRTAAPEVETCEIACLDLEASQELLRSLAPCIAERAPTVAELSGGLPLALRFFAICVREQPLTPIDNLIRSFRATLATDGPVAAAIRLSYYRLAPKLQMRLSLLAVFASDFQLSAAESVWELDEATTRGELQRLVNVSLLQHDNHMERFTLHGLVRAFIENEHPDWIWARARLLHARYYSLITNLVGDLVIQGGEPMLLGLKLFDQEHSDIDAAFNFIRQENLKKYGAILADLGHVAGLIGAFRFSPDQQIEWLTATRAAAKRAKCTGRYIDATGNLANAHFRQREYERARPYATELLLFSRRIGDRVREGNALTSLAVIERSTGHPERAIELLDTRLLIARETGDVGAIVRALNNRANAYGDLDNTEEELKSLKEALALAESSADMFGRAVTMNNLGCTYLKRGEWDNASRCFEERLLAARALGDVDGAAKALANLSDTNVKRGDAGKAVAWLEQLLKIQQIAGERQKARGGHERLTRSRNRSSSLHETLHNPTCAQCPRCPARTETLSEMSARSFPVGTPTKSFRSNDLFFAMTDLAS